ncbi:hypothetical protein B0O80DRAFT_483053 [Mortierella sp. GBAus27b]|nr:hypothetical protein BGX31_005636 [Mortierella sp. GBA43]KAI8362213.1 hypothetical protein B0O80DRAFT_483053 [Mortierella sp. GBAus27b]
MQLLRRSVLLLKEAPGGDPEGQGQGSSDAQQQRQPAQETDQYRSALRSLATDQVETTVDYLPPMTTLFPESTELSQAIAAGYPNTPYDHRGLKEHRSPAEGAPSNNISTSGFVWAFVVTSQNAVHAIDAALQLQPHPDIREAWLEVPIYCLTGATLASVKRVGFKVINCPNPLATELVSGLDLSFDNGAQLVDFLVSLEWPSTSQSSATVIAAEEAVPPQLWFLTGETRMKTLPETLAAHQKPFREIVVYRTGPRPQFEDEFAQWLVDKTAGPRQNDQGVTLGNGNDSPSPPSSTTVVPGRDKGKSAIWLVGFSPRGVDMAVPTLKIFMDGNQHASAPMRNEGCEIRWAAIGSTTAKRIDDHLATTFQALQTDPVPDRSAEHTTDVKLNLTLRLTVAVAKAPKPDAIAEAILS